MRLYFEFFKKAFQERYSFRFDFYSSIFSSFLVLAISVSIWKALYANLLAVNMVSLSEVLTYTVVSSMMITLTTSQSSRKLAERIEQGTIVSDFVRPVSMKNYLLAEDLGNNLFKALLIQLPAVFVAIWAWKIPIVANESLFFPFFACLVSGVLIAFHIHYIFGLLTFWLETSWYIPFFITAVMNLFSGSVIPIWFYPDWLQTLTMWLPFKYIFFEPISVFLGKHDFMATMEVLLIQFAWLAFLLLLQKLVWIRVQTKVFTQGG